MQFIRSIVLAQLPPACPPARCFAQPLLLPATRSHDAMAPKQAARAAAIASSRRTRGLEFTVEHEARMREALKARPGVPRCEAATSWLLP